MFAQQTDGHDAATAQANSIDTPNSPALANALPASTSTPQSLGFASGGNPSAFGDWSFRSSFAAHPNDSILSTSTAQDSTDDGDLAPSPLNLQSTPLNCQSQ